MPYSPTAGAQAIQGAIQTNLTAAGFSTAPSVTPGQAIADGFLSGIGYIAQNDSAGAGEHTTTSFVNCFGQWTTPTILAKTYLLHVDISCYMTANADQALFRIVLDSTTNITTPTNAMKFYFNSLSVHQRIHFCTPISFSAGTHTLQLQFATLVNGQINSDTTDCRLFTLVG